MARRLRALDGTELSALPLRPSSIYHLFLSHVWGTGQDQMRIVKQRLLEMLPNLSIFLDVDIDGFVIAALEQYIDQSDHVLIFCSTGYTESRNCLLELRRAVLSVKPLIALVETEDRHGGVCQATMVERLARAEARFGEWGFEAEPSGCAVSEVLFADEPIEWTRLGAMQDVTLRLIGERLLGLRGSTAMQASALASMHSHPTPDLT